MKFDDFLEYLLGAALLVITGRFIGWNLAAIFSGEDLSASIYMYWVLQLGLLIGWSVLFLRLMLSDRWAPVRGAFLWLFFALTVLLGQSRSRHETVVVVKDNSEELILIVILLALALPGWAGYKGF